MGMDPAPPATHWNPLTAVWNNTRPAATVLALLLLPLDAPAEAPMLLPGTALDDTSSMDCDVAPPPELLVPPLEPDVEDVHAPAHSTTNTPSVLMAASAERNIPRPAHTQQIRSGRDETKGPRQHHRGLRAGHPIIRAITPR